MLRLKNIGWMFEVFLFIYKRLAGLVEEWYVNKSTKDSTRQPFQRCLEIKKFALFLAFLREKVLELNFFEQFQTVMEVFSYQFYKDSMSPEAQVLFLCRTRMNDENLKPKLLSLITWLKSRLYNRQFVLRFAETASSEALFLLLTGHPDLLMYVLTSYHYTIHNNNIRK